MKTIILRILNEFDNDFPEGIQTNELLEILMGQMENKFSVNEIHETLSDLINEQLINNVEKSVQEPLKLQLTKKGLYFLMQQKENQIT